MGFMFELLLIDDIVKCLYQVAVGITNRNLACTQLAKKLGAYNISVL
jgi:hypothetical protein